MIVVGLVVIFFVFLLRHLAFAASALSAAPGDMRSRIGFDFGYRPFVTVLVPCRNEELVIEGLIETLLAFDYPADRHELIVIDDGSDDATGEIVDGIGRRHPRLRCLHRAPHSGGGKSGALNEALAVSRGDVVVVFDADHRAARGRSPPARAPLRRSQRRRGAGPLPCAQLERVAAARTIAVDYYSGYLVNEYGRQSLYDLPAYGGSNSAVRRSWLDTFGGWNEQTVTEDTDLTLRLVMVGQFVRYDITAIDTEESVPTFRRFWRQRYRWARGHQQAWREFRGAALRTPHLSITRKIETFMFLLVYHVPVLCALGLVMVVLRAAGVLEWGQGIDLTPIATLLFLGPLLELASGLIVSRAPRKAAWGILLFLPTFVIFTVVCTKSWFDGILGRPYTWAKTPRTGHGQARTVEAAAA